jgi:hypothetical protein
VQVSEAQLGRRTRCIACSSVFVAEPSAPAVPAPSQAPSPLDTEGEETPAPLRQRGMPRHRLPLCPGCSRPVSWDVLACPHCGHLFDPQDGPATPGGRTRRDSDGHRGGLIDSLGTLSLLAGVLALCTGPIGLSVALLTGIPAWVMASHDLPRMASGVVDPQGRRTTEYGRRKAVAGVALGVLFGLFFLLVFAESFSF